MILSDMRPLHLCSAGISPLNHTFNPSFVRRSCETSGAVEPGVRITFLIKSRKLLVFHYHLFVHVVNRWERFQRIPSLFVEIPLVSSNKEFMDVARSI